MKKSKAKAKVVEAAEVKQDVFDYVAPKIVEGYHSPLAYRDGMINCTLVHAEHGEIPFTYSPDDNSVACLELKELFDADGITFEGLEQCPSVQLHTNMEARDWRDKELKRSDIIINKIEDFEVEGDSKVWRQYRVALRNWPASESFPDVKPTAPDAE